MLNSISLLKRLRSDYAEVKFNGCAERVDSVLENPSDLRVCFFLGLEHRSAAQIRSAAFAQLLGTYQVQSVLIADNPDYHQALQDYQLEQSFQNSFALGMHFHHCFAYSTYDENMVYDPFCNFSKAIEPLGLYP